ncbi:MAG TPA: hypothetical protein VHA52_01040, partial [Candidatus Babeliaceae bacterium]|nr:hypothetical protein [Candidatus Babeliaceae bacterium]
IIPGVIWGIKFFFYQHLLVDQHVGIIESFRKSAQLTYGSIRRLLALFIILGLVNFLGLGFSSLIRDVLGNIVSSGLLVFTIGSALGFIVTLPLSCLANTYTYRKLLDGEVKSV